MSIHSSKLSVTFDEKRIDAIFAEVNQCRLPGLAAGIAIDGRTVYRKGFGLASLELPVALSPTIRMRIGSVSKQFTAFGFMMLCEEGRANIDDTVGKYLPELNPVAQKVTMRQLMGNNSGLQDATDLCLQFSGAEGRRISTADLMSFYRDCDEVTASPGATNIYNNGGWVMLSVIMEKIAERSLEQILWERVFEPIGMYDTLLRRWDYKFIANCSSSHALGDEGKYERTEVVGGLDYAGGGAIASTVDDMLRWLAHMDNPKVGTAKTWELMKTPQKLLSGASTAYGLGLINQRLRGVNMISHSGGGWGSNAQMIKIPEAGFDVIVISNRVDRYANTFATKILESCLPTLGPEDDAYQGPFPEGVFRSPKTGRAVQLGRVDTGYFLVGQKIPVAALDGHRIPITPDKKGVLRPTNDLFVELAITPIGDPLHPSSLRLVQFGIVDELIAVKRSANPPTAAIVGRYRSTTTGTEAIVSATDGGVRLKMIGRFGSTEHALEYLAGGVWQKRLLNRRISPIWGFLLFDDDFAEFGFYTYPTRNVRFRRVE